MALSDCQRQRIAREIAWARDYCNDGTAEILTDVLIEHDRLVADNAALAAEVERLTPLAEIGSAFNNLEGVQFLSVQYIADNIPMRRWHFAIQRGGGGKTEWTPDIGATVSCAGLLDEEGDDAE